MSIDKIDIRLILDGCLHGNRNSQLKLYESFHGYGLSICLRYAKNRQEAVEILNDAFLKIFQHLDQYDSTYSFRPWIRRIFINTAIDHHRKYFHQLNWEFLSPAIENSLASDIQISADTDLLPILQLLPPTYRTVFNLYVMEEYKHHEIAENLGISVSTSRSNLLRAKKKLRTILSKTREKVKIN